MPGRVYFFHIQALGLIFVSLSTLRKFFRLFIFTRHNKGLFLSLVAMFFCRFQAVRFNQSPMLCVKRGLKTDYSSNRSGECAEGIRYWSKIDGPLFIASE